MAPDTQSEHSSQGSAVDGDAGAGDVAAGVGSQKDRGSGDLVRFADPTQWVVFEPNDEPLWSQIRLTVGAFMEGLFRQGAFKGQNAREAYMVKCDMETTTQSDINLGIVNFVVGFAPLKPSSTK